MGFPILAILAKGFAIPVWNQKFVRPLFDHAFHRPASCFFWQSHVIQSDEKMNIRKECSRRHEIKHNR